MCMMRFKKGSKVEVMKKEEEVPTSWRVAEIVSGYGHTYIVRYGVGYESYSMPEFDALFERVLRKVIRPCPPSIPGVKNWKAGDVVEVFVDDSWKIATILNVLGEDLYHVRPHGSNLEYMVNNVDIRMQQSWQDGKWILIGTDRLPIQNEPEPRIVSSRTPKRVSPYSSSLLDPNAQKAKKLKANAKKQIGYYEKERRKSNGVVGSRLSDPNESENDECSVGSCSVVNESANRFSRQPIVVTCQGTDTLCGNAESFHCSREEEQICSIFLEENLEESIHRLELHAYRSTLEALYASGPLSWEKEAILTNLRISLHISNDEHLIEIRNLISIRAG